MITRSPLEDLRETVAARLRGLFALATIPVITRQTGDLQYALDKAIAELGLWIIVTIDRAQHDGSQTACPRYEARLSIDVGENVLLYQGATGGKPGGWSVAALIDAELQQLQLNVGDQTVLLQQAEPMSETSGPEDDALLVTLSYKTRIAGNPRATTN